MINNLPLRLFTLEKGNNYLGMENIDFTSGKRKSIISLTLCLWWGQEGKVYFNLPPRGREGVAILKGDR